MDEQQRYEAGMKVRREVLGDAHVDRSEERVRYGLVPGFRGTRAACSPLR